MNLEFRLPDIGEGTAGAEILEWHVGVGDRVKEFDPMVDVQTDKAIVAIPSPVDGVVTRLAAEIDDTISVGDVLIVFAEVSETQAAALKVSHGSERAETPAEASPTETSPAEVSPAETSPGETAPAGSGSARPPMASPAVRKLAQQAGVDLASIVGGGPGGRILPSDIAAATAHAADPPSTRLVAPSATSASEVVPLQGTRAVIARRMTESWQTVPHVMDVREVDMTAILETRDRLQALYDRARRDDPVRITTLALLARIASVVVRRHPVLNASVDMGRGAITLHGEVNLSVAISSPGGVVDPVIRQADRLPIDVIASEIARLAAAAADRTLTHAELTGGTFTVNNYGALGSPQGTMLVSPGQSANLGFGRVQDKAVVRDGQVVVRPIMNLGLAADHRAMDGAEMQAFVNEVVGVIEYPALILGTP